MYYLQKFNSHAEFTAALGNNSTKLNNYAPWVVWDGEEVHYFNENTYKLGDIIQYELNGTIRNLVCVIPSNTIDNGKARFIVDYSLGTSMWFNLSSITSDNSGSIDIPNFYKKNIPSYKTSENISNWGSSSTLVEKDWSRVSSDTFSNNSFKDPLDYLTYWYTLSDEDRNCPSPWIQTDANSPLIYNTNYGIYAASGDFKGKENTDYIINFYNQGPSKWTGTNGANAATGSNIASNYQCAAKLVRDTLGSKAYLPAIGELGFLMARLATINSKLSNKVSGYVWSSTQYSARTAYYLCTVNGSLDLNYKFYGLSVRAFVQL